VSGFWHEAGLQSRSLSGRRLWPWCDCRIVPPNGTTAAWPSRAAAAGLPSRCCRAVSHDRWPRVGRPDWGQAETAQSQCDDSLGVGALDDLQNQAPAPICARRVNAEALTSDNPPRRLISRLRVAVRRRRPTDTEPDAFWHPTRQRVRAYETQRALQK